MVRVLVAVWVLFALSGAYAGSARAAQDPTPTPTPTTPTATAPVDEELKPEPRYKKGKSLFDYGDWPNALVVLAPLAVPGQLQDEKEQLDVHRMLGICYALSDKQLEAAREFSSLLSIDPDFALDPFLTPPAAIEIFEKQKAAMKQQLEELRRARDKARENAVDEHGGVLVEKTTVVRQVPLAVAFMPFGLGQAANGDTAKAVVIGAAQGVTLATTITLFWTSMAMLANQETRQSQQNEDIYNGVVVAELIAAGAFGISYGVGVGEALYSREDGAVVDSKQTKRTLTPEELRDVNKVAPGTPAPAAAAAAAPAPKAPPPP